MPLDLNQSVKLFSVIVRRQHFIESLLILLTNLCPLLFQFLRKVQTQFQVFCATIHHLRNMKVDASDSQFDSVKRKHIFEDIMSRTSLILTEMNQEMADVGIEQETRIPLNYKKVTLPKEVDLTDAMTYDYTIVKRYVNFLKKVSRKYMFKIGKAKRNKKIKTRRRKARLEKMERGHIARSA